MLFRSREEGGAGVERTSGPAEEVVEGDRFGALVRIVVDEDAERGGRNVPQELKDGAVFLTELFEKAGKVLLENDFSAGGCGFVHGREGLG